jgi:hypothetical protein
LQKPVDAPVVAALHGALQVEDHPAFRRDLEAALARLEGVPAH